MAPAQIVAEYPDRAEEDVRQALDKQPPLRKIRFVHFLQGSEAVPR
jgi:hypothetical protein